MSSSRRSLRARSRSARATTRDDRSGARSSPTAAAASCSPRSDSRGRCPRDNRRTTSGPSSDACRPCPGEPIHPFVGRAQRTRRAGGRRSSRRRPDPAAAPRRLESPTPVPWCRDVGRLPWRSAPTNSIHVPRRNTRQYRANSAVAPSLLFAHGTPPFAAGTRPTTNHQRLTTNHQLASSTATGVSAPVAHRNAIGPRLSRRLATNRHFSGSVCKFVIRTRVRECLLPIVLTDIIMSFAGLGTDLAIDLGTANTCVFALGKGVIVNEPSLIAFNTSTGAIEAVGEDARDMLGRTPERLRPVRPIRDGVIADFDATEKMLTYFIRKTNQQVGGWARPRVVFGVPSQITPVERRAVKESAYRAKVSEVFLVDEPMAAALGAGLPITEAGRQHDHRRRRRHHRHRRHLALRRRHQPLGARRRRRVRRCHHSAPEAPARSAHRRAHRRSDQAADRIGHQAGQAADDGSEGPASREGRAGESDRLRRRDPRSDRRAAEDHHQRRARNARSDSAGAVLRHLRSRRRPVRRQRAAPQPRSSSSRGDAAARERSSISRSRPSSLARARCSKTGSCSRGWRPSATSPGAHRRAGRLPRVR